MTTVAAPAGVYDERRDHHAAWLDQHVLERLRLAPCSVLDVGCGDGFWAELLHERGFTVTGIDKRPAALEAAQARSGPTFELADAEAARGERYGVAFCRTLPHFFEPAMFEQGHTRALLHALSLSCRQLLLVAYTNVESWDEATMFEAVEEFADVKAMHRADHYLIVLARFGIPYLSVEGKPARYPHSFGLDDLDRLDGFLNAAVAVIPLGDVAGGNADDRVIAVRHDVDHSLEQALRFAAWEHERGYRTSYFLLPTAWYWRDKGAVRAAIMALQGQGHEVGLHNNAVAAAWQQQQLRSVDGSALPAGFCEAAADLLRDWLAELRALGADVKGTAAHGAGFPVDNQALWAAGYTPADFGLQYEAYHLHARHSSPVYGSDNGGRWPRLLHRDGSQTHLLLHPEHWALP